MESLSSLLLTFAELQELLKGSCGAINPNNVFQRDSSGYGLEIWPEKRQELGHKPKVTDVLKFYERNKEIFDSYPELRIGWDRTELNIGAVSQSEEIALRLGNALEQRAIFDITEGQEIELFYPGDRVNFAWYPIEDRLRDLARKVA